jgi:hypothetical protein
MLIYMVMQSEIEILAQRFVPYFYFHPNEKYYPVTPDYLMSGCELYFGDKGEGYTVIPQGQLTQNNLVNQISTTGERSGNFGSDELEERTKFRLLIKDKKILSGQKDMLDNIPVYCFANVIRTQIGGNSEKVLTFIDFFYYALYANNGATAILGLGGAHDFDIEGVIVRYNYTGGVIHRVFMTQHSGGEWLLPNQIERDGDHVIAYAAKYSHTTYPAPKVWVRMFGLANDTTKKGILWKPRVEYLDLTVQRANNMWSHFTGTMDFSTQVLPHYRSAWRDTTSFKLSNPSTLSVLDKELNIGTKFISIGALLSIIATIIIIIAIYSINITVIIGVLTAAGAGYIGAGMVSYGLTIRHIN